MARRRVLLAALLAPLPFAELATAHVRSAPDFPDPFVVRDEATFLAFATGAHGRHVQVSRSRDLTTWTALPDALPNLPSWASREAGLTWAPSALRRPHGWVLYFTTRDT